MEKIAVESEVEHEFECPACGKSLSNEIKTCKWCHREILICNHCNTAVIREGAGGTYVVLSSCKGCFKPIQLQED